MGLAITWEVLNELAVIVAQRILDWNNMRINPSDRIHVYGIPRGGVYAAMLVAQCNPIFVLAESPEYANVFVDDLIDSGATRDRMFDAFPEKPFFALTMKTGEGWLTFPWERMNPKEESGIEDNITRILQFIGEDVNRDGLKDTPRRVAKSYKELFRGYADVNSIKEILVTFESDYDEMVVLKDIEFYSFCEHHMLPFFGKAHVAYIPNGRVVGISKLARLVDIFSRRLQIQERLCSDVVEALMTHLNPLGAACVVEAQHFCMMCRGVGKQNSVMVTSALSPRFKEVAVRAELMSLIGK